MRQRRKEKIQKPKWLVRAFIQALRQFSGHKEIDDGSNCVENDPAVDLEAQASASVEHAGHHYAATGLDGDGADQPLRATSMAGNACSTA